MRRVENLIERIRRETENEEFTPNTGISDEEIVDFLRDAQSDLQSAIARQHQDVFIAEKKMDVVYSQEAYDLPEDILLQNRISKVWYSSSGDPRRNKRLRPSNLTERIFDRASTPAMYIRRNRQLLLNPIPTKNVVQGLTINYVKKLPDLDKRRAKIATVTLDTNTITSLFLDITAELEREELLKEDHLCIVSKSGDQKMRRIPFTDIDPNTGEVILEAFTFEDGETAAAGDYIVSGYDAYNLSDLPDTCERYLVSYGKLQMFKRDSSYDSQEATSELMSMRDEIVEIFKEVDDDVKNIPINDTQFIDDMDDWNFY